MREASARRGIVAIAFLVAGVTVLGSLLLRTPPQVNCGGRCNVILIEVDTLAADHLAVYGYSRDTMPKTTAFFEQHGVIFDNASTAAPWTFPSFTALYFSDLASTVSFRDLTGQTDRPYLQQELRTHGVTVRAALNPRSVFIFDAVNGLFKTNEQLVDYALESQPASTDPARHKDQVRYASGLIFSSAENAVPALEQASVASSTPYFLMLHLFLVHDPYAPTAPFDQAFASTTNVQAVDMNELEELNSNAVSGQTISTTTLDLLALRYDQGILETDTDISNFIASLPPDVLRNTVIIVTADHGEGFGQHDSVWHGRTLYQEELQVPLMMYVPGITGGERVEEPVSTLDYAPTILALAGVPVPSAFIGKSLVPLLEGGTLGQRILPFENGYPYFLQHPTTAAPISLAAVGAASSSLPVIEQQEIGVRTGDYKLIYGGVAGPKPLQMYDLAVDPGERADLLIENAMPSYLFDPLASEFRSIIQKYPR